MAQVNHLRPRALTTLLGVLKKTADAPTTRAVHKTRTTIRRVETILAGHTGEDRPRKLLRQITAIRKSAGKVRDVDVHLAILRSLRQMGPPRDVAELSSYLCKQRAKRERKLVATIEERLNAQLGTRLHAVAVPASRAAAEIDLESIAGEFADLGNTAHNKPALHRFRLECKRLRYTAELAEESEFRKLLIANLIKVQNACGEWHDTVTLCEIAEEVLGSTRALIPILKASCRAKLNEALRIIPAAVQSVSPKGRVIAMRKPVSSEDVEGASTAIA